MNLQTLVVTVGQSDFSLIEKMNLRSDSIIANQASNEGILKYAADGYHFEMITTNTRGVGINRNVALLNSTAEIVLFSDDDVIYNDDYRESVLHAYEDYPDADVIIFGIDFVTDGKVTTRIANNNRRLNPLRFGKYGAVVISAKKTALMKNNIMFNMCFGGGCVYGSGEDSIFLLECIKKGLRIYTNSYSLGRTIHDNSSWFHGFGEKYFFDRGALYAYMFGVLFPIVVLCFCCKRLNGCRISFIKRIKLMCQGKMAYKNLIGFEQWKERTDGEK